MSRLQLIGDFSLSDFKFGLDWTSNSVAVKDQWLINAKNVNLSTTGTISKRQGCSAFPTTNAQMENAAVTSIYEYNAPDGNNYILAACNQTLWRRNANTWTALKTGLTANSYYSFASTNGYCFITNGTDDMFKLKNTTVYTTIGLDAPTVTPTVALSAVGYTAITEDYNAETNVTFYNLRNETARTKLAQTFTMQQEGIVTSIVLHCAKISSPTGNMWVSIYSDGGSGPGVIVGSISATVDVSTISATHENVTFTLSDQPTLSTNTKYWLVIEADYAIGTDYIRVFRNATDYTGGASYYYNATSWIYAGADFNFQITFNKPANVTGRYKWVYAWKTSSGLITNYSPASEAYIVRAQTATVTCKYSTNSEVTYVMLYRTFDMGDEDSTDYFLVSETANLVAGGDVAIVDAKTDNDLTTKAENNNTAPPLAKYLVVYQDRLIYANCPDETDGHSLFMISKVGSPESVPSANYHYFDRDDGNEITGIAMLPDYLVIFKKNKIATMSRDFSEWNTISRGIGCISPWAIITLTDKIVFLSEEGPKCTDGKTVYDISKKLLAISEATLMANVWDIETGICSSGVYYPYRKQFFFNLYNNGEIMLVGHWLASLYMEITPEFAQDDNYVGWTYHQYLNHTITTLGTYTNGDGITKILAGTYDGYVYELDYGSCYYDVRYDGTQYDIPVEITTGWTSLGISPSATKTIRFINIVGANENGTSNVNMYVDTDFVEDTTAYSMDIAGTQGSVITHLGGTFLFSSTIGIVDNRTGKMFRFRFSGADKDAFDLISIQPLYRVEGIR